MRRFAIIGGLVSSLIAAVVWWTFHEEPPAEPRVVAPGDPLPVDESVRMRWVDSESGEEETWTVTKRDSLAADRGPRPMPEPDPTSEDHRPDESARALYGMGLESWKAGEIREAITLFEESIELDPDDPLPRTQYGRLLVLGMSYGEALVHLERAAELSPDDPQVWLDLVTLHEKTLALESSWAARRRAEALTDGREIYQDSRTGFWVIPETSVLP
jgi:hypothetical protein